MKHSEVLALTLLILGGTLLAQVTNDQLSLAAVPSDSDIALGESYTATVEFSSAVAGVEAWAFGLCVDPTMQEVLQAQPGVDFNTLRFGGPPEWWVINTETGGVTQAVMLDTRLGSTLGVIPEDDPLSILTVDLRPTDKAADKEVTATFCDTLGAPSVITQFVIADAGFKPGTMTPARVTVVRDPGLLLSYGKSVYQLGLSGGATVDTEIRARSTSKLYGFSFGVQHDPALVSIVEVKAAPELVAALGGKEPEFFASDLTPENGSGFTIGVLFQTSAPVPPATDLKYILSTAAVPATPVIVARYRAAETATNDQTARLSIVGTLGVPAVPVLYDIGTEAVPTARGCDVVISDTPVEVPFKRGEINNDGAINISDVVMLLRYLFAGQVLSFDCLEALDCNDDEGVNVGDAIYLLGYQFRNGPMPPAPFPDCGSIPDGPEFLGCVTFPLCKG